MILGDVCTRNCAYCAVAHGTPKAFDPLEPVAPGRRGRADGAGARGDHVGGPRRPAGRRRRGVRRMHHRDPPAAARHLGRGADPRLQGLRARAPDRDGRAARHPQPQPRDRQRLYRLARPGGRYDRALELLARARRMVPDVLTKSGIILGMGEEWDELLVCMRDLRRSDVDILTLGQYLRPSDGHLPVARYYTPDEFAELRDIGLAHGIHPRAVEPADPLHLSRLGAGARPPERAAPDGRLTATPTAARVPRGGARPRRAPTSTATGSGRCCSSAASRRRPARPTASARSAASATSTSARRRSRSAAIAALAPRRLHHLLLPRARPGARARHQRRAR